MRKNNNFTVKKLFWPLVALAALVAGAIWTNAGVVGHRPFQTDIPLNTPQNAPESGLVDRPPTAVIRHHRS